MCIYIYVFINIYSKYLYIIFFIYILFAIYLFIFIHIILLSFLKHLSLSLFQTFLLFLFHFTSYKLKIGTYFIPHLSHFCPGKRTKYRLVFFFGETIPSTFVVASQLWNAEAYCKYDIPNT